MNKKTVFRGSGVAIVTPFNNGAVDYTSLGKLIDRQIAGSTDAIIICGTTGEGSTLTDAEHKECIRFAVEHTAHRVPVIAGTGSNDTIYAVELSKYAYDVGADALLLVTPYYNKATPTGLIKSFLAVADKIDCPVILYNVPSRTGVNIPMSVYRELAGHERIVGVKEASGNISQIAELFAECGDSFDIYSGNDDQIVPFMSLGGAGVISVLANVCPRETHDICALYDAGAVKESAELQLRLLDLINALFIEVNPIPVKTAMEMMGVCSAEMRLPLCEMSVSNSERLRAALVRHGFVR